MGIKLIRKAIAMNPVQSPQKHKDPLHGITLQMIVEHLYNQYGWDTLSTMIEINCFKTNPSIKSSLSFLRKTPWARTKVESLYLWSLREIKRNESFKVVV